jgi:hypothetical protein
MTRGNRREIDRQRAVNRHASKGKKVGLRAYFKFSQSPILLTYFSISFPSLHQTEGDPTARRENDAKALQDKIAKKAAEKAAAGEGDDGGGGGGDGKGKKR